jgi:hypothetical protein
MDAEAQKLHYHIRWSGKEDLDWERFATHAQADERAKELVRPNEEYTVEQQGKECPWCTDNR